MNGCANRFTASTVARVMGSALRRDMLPCLAETGLFRPRGSAFPEAVAAGREVIGGRLGPPGPDGDPVLAAATLADDFFADTIDLDPSEAVPALRRMRGRIKIAFSASRRSCTSPRRWTHSPIRRSATIDLFPDFVHREPLLRRPRDATRSIVAAMMAGLRPAACPPSAS
ncbi:MAG: hypothetical protein F4213_01540 [Boseongicola sp. SB0677_bin_26]|nr:hypothetical protein [Boseongicola sp. SB0665_bin_10]MYG24699.1 hypothetical protein [Boseongicola sp. SB0677_bin_26]